MANEDRESAPYRLFGSENSAFSGKLRSYMRYKNAKCAWITRTEATEKELQAVSRFSTLPVLVTPSGYAAHDTTAVIEALETDLPDRAVIPEDPGLAFIAALIEEYADTWLSKSVMQYRWMRLRDQKKAAERTIDQYFPNGTGDRDRETLGAAVIDRMREAVSIIGLNAEVGALVERSANELPGLIAPHLHESEYLFGGRPSIADFALAAQLDQMRADSVPAKLIAKAGPWLAGWLDRVGTATESGPFLPLALLRDGLKPFLKKEVVGRFLPWAAANVEASIAGEKIVEVAIGRRTISHAPIGAAARSFRELRRKFAHLQDDEAKKFLDGVGASPYLIRPARD